MINPRDKAIFEVRCLLAAIGVITPQVAQNTHPELLMMGLEHIQKLIDQAIGHLRPTIDQRTDG